MPAPTGYTRVQIQLHWIIAALIVLQYIFKDAIAAAWDDAQKGVATAFDPLVMGHVVGGGLVLVLAVWRIGLRLQRAAPPPPEHEHPALRALAKLTHLALYALMILMPVSGAIAWFGSVNVAAQGHNILKVALLALVGLHLAGALYQQFVLRTGILSRMSRAES